LLCCAHASHLGWGKKLIVVRVEMRAISDQSPIHRKVDLMSKEIYWVFSISVRAGRFDEFKKLVGEVVAETRQESGALAYEYSVHADQSTVHIFERYRDSAAAITHIDQTFVPFAERFLSLVTVTGLVVYGAPDEVLRNRLDGFGAVYMSLFDGLSLS
jgi:quinol monooxygenase YgiN